jgi:hypothetical protein
MNKSIVCVNHGILKNNEISKHARSKSGARCKLCLDKSRSKNWNNLGEITCSICKSPKSIDNFTEKNTSSPQCKLCRSVRAKEFREKNKINYLFLDKKRKSKKSYKDKAEINNRNNWLYRNYRITPDKFELMLKNQNNVCAICKNNETRINKKLNLIKNLSVDHCHKTGKVRGLLCNNCNTSLGRFKDSIELLESAINYLKNNDFL